MKKLFGLMVMSLIAFLPLSAKAATGIVPNCSNQDENGNITCTVAYTITGTEAVDNLTVTLTERGGAEISSIFSASESEWTVQSQNENSGVWTVQLTSFGVVGEGDLFSFTYKASGSTECEIGVALNNETATIKPATIPDQAADNKQTGATLPYIALGVIAVVAVGAYLATRNKAKMYKI